MLPLHDFSFFISKLIKAEIFAFVSLFVEQSNLFL